MDIYVLDVVHMWFILEMYIYIQMKQMNGLSNKKGS